MTAAGLWSPLGGGTDGGCDRLAVPVPAQLAEIVSSFQALPEEAQHEICAAQRISAFGPGPAVAQMARDNWGLGGKNHSQQANELFEAAAVAYGPFALGDHDPGDLAGMLRRDSHAAERPRGLAFAAREIRHRRQGRQLARQRALNVALRRPLLLRAPHRLRASRHAVRIRSGRVKANRAGPASSDDEPGPAARCAQPAGPLPEALHLGAALALGSLLIHVDGRAPGRSPARPPLLPPRRAHHRLPRLSCGPPKP